MKISFRLICLTFLYCVFHLNAIAQKDSIPPKERKLTVLPLPVFQVDPAIGAGFGANIAFNYRLGPKETTRNSNAFLYGVYTTKKQSIFSIDHATFTRDEHWFLSGLLEYRYFPQNFYGSGGNSSIEDEEQISYEAITFRERALYQVKPHWFVGMQYRYYQVSNIRVESSPLAPSTSTPPWPIVPERVGQFFSFDGLGNQGFRSSGLGIHTLYDTRDNILNPYQGVYAELAFDVYPQWLGSTLAYHTLRVDLRAYRKLFERLDHILAARLYGDFASSEVPFIDSPQTGVNYTTRGYVLSRYRGQRFVTAELEYRARLWKRLGAAVFSNVHSVTEPDTQQWQYWNLAVGAGLRVMIDKQDRVNVRVDYAVGKDDNSGLYIIFAEAF
ncbi:BamA/TamA family outer membrane protein [Eisenibacter elegans]|uniref:BamA/TamA family outer membrane protein n=1 Tax=Eisenibacter elegans TaxID=997 RepID=UPI0009D712A1|nr:BamA/TamA family outer membrane protein [Eisenibacter elegans]